MIVSLSESVVEYCSITDVSVVTVLFAGELNVGMLGMLLDN